VNQIQRRKTSRQGLYEFSTVGRDHGYAWVISMRFYSSQKQGGAARPQHCMDKFREPLEECGLADLGYSRYMFTWRNHHQITEGYIQERLDRAVANLEWRDLFLRYELINGEQRHSDHIPIILVLEGSHNI
jgi:hypothetical protein